MMEDMIDDLQRAQWIDAQTAFLSVHMTIRNNHVGLRFLSRFYVEMSPLGGAHARIGPRNEAQEIHACVAIPPPPTLLLPL